ncbi:MAG: sulfur carrier protein ThiS [Planctomycetota bacterium]|nr:MAG: sulfur carrier protein ThiS [Planctomycetota bacterium]
MTVKVNGETRKIPAETTVSGLIESMNIRTSMFAVERNKKVVRRAEHASTVLSDGDVLNIVTFVGGG